MRPTCAGNDRPPLEAVPRQERPAGWYRDPTRPTGHRYWDGHEWRDDAEAPED